MKRSGPFTRRGQPARQGPRWPPVLAQGHKRPAPSESAAFDYGCSFPSPQFARLLGVSPETYRAWTRDAGPCRDAWITRAKELAAAKDPRRLWSLEQLAAELGVHARTLRDAARSGRLGVTYGNRVVFRNPVPRATLTAGRAFLERYYRQSYSRFASKPMPPERTHVPSDWARQLLRVRRELGLTQGQLAERISAAGKAVVYQWESGKRRPSPVFWKKIEQLSAVSVDRRADDSSVTSHKTSPDSVRLSV
jgi:DNA-binding transcriptional regulator YiaG